MKTLIIVQSRMTSTRLPGKVMLPVLGKSLIEYLIERLKRTLLADGICIACTTNVTDEPIVQLATRLGVHVYRGSEEDVLGRHAAAAAQFNAENIVRVTSDCPLIDPLELDKLIDAYFKAAPRPDYMSSGMIRTYPRGMEAEIFSADALASANSNAVKKYEREHVTPYLYTNPGIFKLKEFLYPQDISHHRWTVDTPEDFELVSRIIEALYPVKPEFTLLDILDLMDSNKEWQSINSHVYQKHYTE